VITQRALIVVIVAFVVLLVADTLITRYWPLVPGNTAISAVVIFAVLAYIVAAIAARGSLRFPGLPKRRRMRVVKRDPSQAASDFIRQFEDRSKR
jgi:hypothetical protein